LQHVKRQLLLLHTLTQKTTSNIASNLVVSNIPEVRDGTPDLYRIEHAGNEMVYPFRKIITPKEFGQVLARIEGKVHWTVADELQPDPLLDS